MNRNRQISYGAMMTALLGVFLLLNRLTGQLIENFLIYVYPMPVLIYGVQYGWKSSWMVSAAMVLLAFVISTPASFMIASGQVFIGLIYGCCLHDHVSKHIILVITISISAVFALLQMVVFAGFFGYDNEADIAAAEEIYNKLLTFFHRSLPEGFDVHAALAKMLTAASLIVGALDGLLIHFLARLLLRRLHLDHPGKKSTW